MIKTDDSASIPKWQSAIDRYANSAHKYPLIEIESVPITENEVNRINQLTSKPLRRLAFTILCIAKFYNLSNNHNNNWVNRADKEIFKLANIQTSTVRQSLLINDLHSEGMISYSKLVDNINIRVEFVDDDLSHGNSNVIYISDFRNLGYQYARFCGDASYVECESCGLIIKKTSNRLRYCRECAVGIDRLKSAERWRVANKHRHS